LWRMIPIFLCWFFTYREIVRELHEGYNYIFYKWLCLKAQHNLTEENKEKKKRSKRVKNKHVFEEGWELFTKSERTDPKRCCNNLARLINCLIWWFTKLWHCCRDFLFCCWVDYKKKRRGEEDG
jgi:hypothetical protein